jgi:alanine dehydrogenase
MTPDGVSKLVQSGNTVVIEKNAGVNSGFSNDQYKIAGAILVSTAEAWNVELVVKVKEPQASEYRYIKNQIIFTFFHLAGVDINLTKELVKKGATALAY